MGGRNMYFVADALDGATVTLPWLPNERRTKSRVNRVSVENEFRRLGANEYLLLLTVAKRQRDADPENGYDEEDCICIGTGEELAAEMRVSPHTFFSSRNFLVRCGLLFFSKEGGVYKDIGNPNVTKHYTNVYRLNKPRLVLLKNACPRRGQAKSTTRTKNVHDVDTEYTYKIIQKNTIGDDVLEIIRGYIATTFGIPRERVGTDGVRAAAKGKDLVVVREAIDKFANDHPGAVCVKNGELKGIAWLIGTLKRLPAAVSPNDMTNDELASLFSAPVSAAAVSAANPLETLWMRLCKGLGLGELPAEALEIVKGACTRHFARYADADRRLAVGAFVDNYLASRGTASLGDLRARLGSAAECARDLSEFLNPASK